MHPNRKGPAVFLALVFALAWGPILIIHFVFDESLLNPLVQLPMAFAPAVAAVVVRLWVTGEGFADAGLRPRLRAAGRYYLLAWVGPVLVVVAVLALAAALGLFRPDLADPAGAVPGMDLSASVLGPILLVAPVLAVPVFLGEELGWRSYLQRRLGHGPVSAAIVTGLIWAAWHYPLVFTDYAEHANPLLGILSWTPSFLAQAVILAWLFERSGSVWVPCLAHAGNNLVVGTLAGALLVDGERLDPTVVVLLELVPLAAIAAWILLTGRLAPPSGERSRAAGRGARSRV